MRSFPFADSSDSIISLPLHLFLPFQGQGMTTFLGYLFSYLGTFGTLTYHYSDFTHSHHLLSSVITATIFHSFKLIKIYTCSLVSFLPPSLRYDLDSLVTCFTTQLSSFHQASHHTVTMLHLFTPPLYFP